MARFDRKYKQRATMHEVQVTPETLMRWPASTREPIDELIQPELLYELMRLLKKLLARERECLLLRYGLDDGAPKTLREVGACLGVTTERVRQIEMKALAHALRLVDKDFLAFAYECYGKQCCLGCMQYRRGIFFSVCKDCPDRPIRCRTCIEQHRRMHERVRREREMQQQRENERRQRAIVRPLCDRYGNPAYWSVPFTSGRVLKYCNACRPYYDAKYNLRYRSECR